MYHLRNVIIPLGLAAALALGLTACGGSAATKEPPTAETPQTEENGTEAAPGGGEKRRVIIDTDTGADDASALILAARSDAVDIIGVTVLVGNVDAEQSAKNALMALEIGGSSAPVYRGAEETYGGKAIEAFSVFGSDGMGDADLIHPSRAAEEKDAVDFILDTVRENPGEIEIIALGPATNLANAIERDAETMKQVKMIWSMGTAGLGPGNASPVAEFNVYADAEAYRYLLDSGLPVTVVGLDMCGDEAMWTDAQFERLRQAGGTGEFVADSFGKLREFYRSNGLDAVMNCDGLAMMCALEPDFISGSKEAHGSCQTAPGETFAQVIFYQKGFTYDATPNDFDCNVRLITGVDKSSYFDRYLSAIG